MAEEGAVLVEARCAAQAQPRRVVAVGQFNQQVAKAIAASKAARTSD